MSKTLNSVYRASILYHRVATIALGVLAEETFSGASTMGEYCQHRGAVEDVSSSIEPSVQLITQSVMVKDKVQVAL